MIDLKYLRLLGRLVSIIRGGKEVVIRYDHSMSVKEVLDKIQH